MVGQSCASPLGCALDGQDNSQGKAVPSLQPSIIRIWDLFKQGAGRAISKSPLITERLRAWQQTALQ